MIENKEFTHTTEKHTIKRERWANGYWIVERNSKGKRTAWKKWSAKPLKRQKNLNIVKNKRKTKFFKAKSKEFQKKHKTKTKTVGTWQQLQIIEQELKKYPDISLYEGQIKKENVKNFKVNIRSGGRINKDKLLKEYKRILKEKINKKDFENIYKHRKKLLKHRLMMKINIYTKIGYVGSIEIGNILLEDEILAHEYWVGQYVDSQNFPSLALEFKNYMPPTNIYVTNHDGKGAGECTHVAINWSIA